MFTSVVCIVLYLNQLKIYNIGFRTVCVDFYRGKLGFNFESAHHLAINLDWIAAIADVEAACAYLRYLIIPIKILSLMPLINNIFKNLIIFIEKQVAKKLQSLASVWVEALP